MNRREIKELLPAVFQRAVLPGTPLQALLDVMEALHARDEEILADLPSYFNGYTARDEFVPYLATWVDLGWLLADRAAGRQDGDETPPLASGLGWLRELVAAAPHLARWRGTARGLERFLEVATGVPGFEVDDAVKGEPFHIVVRAPDGDRAYRALVEQIVEMEKPAYVTHDIKWLRKPGAGT